MGTSFFSSLSSPLLTFLNVKKETRCRHGRASVCRASRNRKTFAVFRGAGGLFAEETLLILRINLSDQLLCNQSPSVINPTDESERLIAKRLIRRIIQSSIGRHPKCPQQSWKKIL